MACILVCAAKIRGWGAHCVTKSKYKIWVIFLVLFQVLGKVSLKKEELSRYQGKDHWFPLQPVHADSEVQGKVQIEINGLGLPHQHKHCITVR